MLYLPSDRLNNWPVCILSSFSKCYQVVSAYCCLLNILFSSSSPSSSWRSSRFNASRKRDCTCLLDCVRDKWSVSSAAPGVLAPIYWHSPQINTRYNTKPLTCMFRSYADFRFVDVLFILTGFIFKLSPSTTFDTPQAAKVSSSIQKKRMTALEVYI